MLAASYCLVVATGLHDGLGGCDFMGLWFANYISIGSYIYGNHLLALNEGGFSQLHAHAMDVRLS